MDAATGLIYVGNGQYYDPETGRFLTRDAKPNNSNPYVPWNPIGAIFAPLAVLSMIYVRRRKRNKWDILVITLVLGIAAGMSVVACGPVPPVTPAPQSTAQSTSAPNTNNSTPAVPPNSQTPGGAGTVPSNTPTITPSPSITPSPTCTNTPTSTPTSTYTPTPTATPNSIQDAISLLQKYSPTGIGYYNYTVSQGIPIKYSNTCGGSSQGKNHPILVPDPSCPKGSPTYIAGTIAHETYHIQTASPHGSLWEEYQAFLIGDIVRDEIIQATNGTSSDMRFPLSVYNVNLNNQNRTQLATDLQNWFINNGLRIYVDPKPKGWDVQPLP